MSYYVSDKHCLDTLLKRQQALQLRDRRDRVVGWNSNAPYMLMVYMDEVLCVVRRAVVGKHQNRFKRGMADYRGLVNMAATAIETYPEQKLLHVFLDRLSEFVDEANEELIPWVSGFDDASVRFTTRAIEACHIQSERLQPLLVK